jgi:hypothetical protein
MANISGRYAIAGIGETAVGSLPGRTTLDLRLEAISLALADAGLRWGSVRARVLSALSYPRRVRCG